MGAEAAQIHDLICPRCEQASRQKIKEMRQEIGELVLEIQKYNKPPKDEEWED
jgi:hypothetical protein